MKPMDEKPVIINSQQKLIYDNVQNQQFFRGLRLVNIRRYNLAQYCSQLTACRAWRCSKHVKHFLMRIAYAAIYYGDV